MMLVLIVVMIVGAVAGLVLRNRQVPAGTPILIVCSVLAILLATGRLAGGLGGPSHQQRLDDELTLTRFIMASEFGRYLAEASTGTRALCILSPHDTRNEAIETGLTEGLGEAIPVEFVLLERDASDELDFITLSAAKVTALLDRHAGTDLIVTMVDLPDHAGGLVGLLRARKVRLAAARLTSPFDAEPYARGGVLAGAVAYQDDPANISDVKDGTPREIFESQFVLIPGRGS